MQQVWAVIKIARQIDGEYIFVNVEKAFDSFDKADKWHKETKFNIKETIHSPTGSIECQIERGVFDMNVE